ncbi:MAG: APC family permease [Myxococcota bacterium]|nr:APC family permease [Myxococcota bacterium]
MSNSTLSSSPQENPTLQRTLGLSSALAIGVGTMIAAGIFTLSGLAVRNVGSGALLSFLLAALVAACTALSYCEFAALYPSSGEGYRYARETLSERPTWLVGFALLLGYCSSCAFYLASFSEYVERFLYALPWGGGAGATALLLLILLNIKGSKESGAFQVVITTGKVLLLLWFVSGGLSELKVDLVSERFDGRPTAILSTSALVFITFFGFSAIAASAGEVKDPVRTIPRAIFSSMAIVTVLYTLVVLTVLVADLDSYDEGAMGVAAERFLGPIGQQVIVWGALFSMISASNASIMAGSRVALAMAERRHLPAPLAQISHRFQSPLNALWLTGALILIFGFLFPLEALAHYADAVLLLVLSMVNGALILHRRRYPNLERPLRIPLVPLIPLIGIGANLSLLVIQLGAHPAPFIYAFGSLALGLAFFSLRQRAQTRAHA